LGGRGVLRQEYFLRQEMPWEACPGKRKDFGSSSLPGYECCSDWEDHSRDILTSAQESGFICRDVALLTGNLTLIS
jgi:hypothetical protein